MKFTSDKGLKEIIRESGKPSIFAQKVRAAVQAFLDGDYTSRDEATVKGFVRRLKQIEEAPNTKEKP